MIAKHFRDLEYTVCYVLFAPLPVTMNSPLKSSSLDHHKAEAFRKAEFALDAPPFLAQLWLSTPPIPTSVLVTGIWHCIWYD